MEDLEGRVPRNLVNEKKSKPSERYDGEAEHGGGS